MRKLNTTTTVRDFMRSHASLIDNLRHYGQILGNSRNYRHMAPTLSGLAKELMDYDPAYCEWTDPFKTGDNERFFILEYNRFEHLTHFNYLERGIFHNPICVNGYAPISLLPADLQYNEEFLDLLDQLCKGEASLEDFVAAVYMWTLKNR